MTRATRRGAPLSDQEVRALALAAGGLTNAAIGQHLRISADTAKQFLSQASRKLDANDRTHAVVKAIAAGELVLADTGRVSPCAGSSAGCYSNIHALPCLQMAAGVVYPSRLPADRPTGGAR